MVIDGKPPGADEEGAPALVGTETLTLQLASASVRRTATAAEVLAAILARPRQQRVYF